MRVEPKVLVRRLNPASTRMLEAAVGAAATGQFYEITCEHLLLKLLEADDGDAAIILQHYGQRRPILIQRVQRSLERMRTGNGGRPVFSETLFQWIGPRANSPTASAAGCSRRDAASAAKRRRTLQTPFSPNCSPPTLEGCRASRPRGG